MQVTNIGKDTFFDMLTRVDPRCLPASTSSSYQLKTELYLYLAQMFYAT